MNIALDISGGDNAPISTIDGAINFIKNNPNLNLHLTLIGLKDELIPFEKKLLKLKSNFTITYSTQTILASDRPSRIIKTKPDSSIVIGLNLLKENKVDAFVSAGSTGPLLASSLLLLGKIKGIDRPAFAPYIPTSSNSGFLLCDAGANSESKPHHLLQFAIMASAYIEHLEKIPSPKVALLNIGKEESKGNDLDVESYKLLKSCMHNFTGNIEARYIMSNKVDIVVCDGFTGNIALKLIEGVFNSLIVWFQSINIPETSNDQISLEPVLLKLKKMLDHEEHGASPLLGINGIVLKTHGSSTSKGICNSLEAAMLAHNSNLISNMTEKLEELIKPSSH